MNRIQPCVPITLCLKMPSIRSCNRTFLLALIVVCVESRVTYGADPAQWLMDIVTTGDRMVTNVYNQYRSNVYNSSLDILLGLPHIADGITSSPSEESPTTTWDGEASAESQRRNASNPLIFDYIVVGAGASGCPFARTMADNGKKVLLLERGRERTYQHTAGTMDVFGTGMVINDPVVSQLVRTSQGVRTHTGAVMGGGTSINMGIFIEETDDYFQHLNRQGQDWDIAAVRQQYKWVKQRVASPQLQDLLFTRRWTSSLVSTGYRPFIIRRDNGDSESSEHIDTPHAKNPGIFVTPSGLLRRGFVWGGMTLFNPQDRFFRNAADVLLGDGYRGSRRVEGVKVMTQMNVDRIFFVRTGSKPRAECVEYSDTSREDLKPIGRRNKKTFVQALLAAKSAAIKRFTFDALGKPRRRRYVACVPPTGEIILAAGAIQTPLLLFKSGVGPLSQIKELGVPLVKEVDELGKNFGDRPFVPIPTYFKNSKLGKRAPRICSSIGFKTSGPECQDMGLFKKTLKCSYVPMEMLSGSNTNLGTVFSTRFVLPPSWRDHSAVDAAFDLAMACHTNPLISRKLCAVFKPVMSCIKNTIATFYLMAEPKSRGYVRMKRSGEVEVVPNYLQDPQDVFDIIRGVQSAIDVVNAPNQKGIVQKLSSKSCPLKILNGLFQVIAKIVYVKELNKYQNVNLQIIRENVEDLLPDNYRDAELLGHFLRRNGTNRNNGNSNAASYSADLNYDDEEETFSTDDDEDDEPPEALEMAIKKLAKLESEISMKLFPSKTENRKKEANETYVDDLLETDASYMTKIDGRRNHQCELVNTCVVNGSGKEQACSTRDVFYNARFNCHSEFNDDQHQYHGEQNASEENVEPNDVQRKQGEDEDVEDPSKRRLFMGIPEQEAGDWLITKMPKNSKQWAASYPPILPSPDDPIQVAKYAQGLVASVWHHFGSASMGKVVDNEFNIIGVDNISIIDASIFTDLPRVNPTSTILMMGRYAALKKLGLIKPSSGTQNSG